MQILVNVSYMLGSILCELYVLAHLIPTNPPVRLIRTFVMPILQIKKFREAT